MGRMLAAELRPRLVAAHPWVARFARPDLVLAAVAGFAGAIILLLGTQLGFVADDLWFASGVIEPVQPHNEHWVAVHTLVMGAIVRVFGNESYVPFLAAQTIAHVSLAAGIFVLLDRTWFAVGAGSLVLFLGSGFEGIFWISTFGIVTATSLGVWAILALRLQRPRVAAVLLTLGFASAGVTLAWWVASIVYAWASDRRAIPWLVLPAIVFGGWFLLFGLQSVAVHRSPTFAPDFMLVGMVASVGAVAGLGTVGGLALVPLLARAGWDALILAALAGLSAHFLVIGAVRGQFGIEYAAVPRYVYAAAPFILLAASRIRVPRMAWLILFATGVVANVIGLARGLNVMVEQAARWR